MVFSSSTFLFLFLPPVLAGYYLIQPKFRNIFLLLASLLFYGFGEPKFVLAMVASIGINYVAARLIAAVTKQKQKDVILAVGILLNLLLLFIFKYMNFVTANMRRFLPDVRVTSFVLPIGISFFTFQAMSYVIDVYRGETAQKNPLDLGLYISFFPQLVPGPIVRYKTISEEINRRTVTWSEFCEGVNGFLNGLVKKIIFANNLALLESFLTTAYKNVIAVDLRWVKITEMGITAAELVEEHDPDIVIVAFNPNQIGSPESAQFQYGLTQN